MSKKRLKLLQKIVEAQATSTDTTTSTAPNTIAGSPREVSISTYFPTFTTAWGANYKAPVDHLLSTLNWAIFTLSVGQMDFENFRQNSFNVDASKYPDPFLMGVVNFSKLVFQTLLNNGVAFTTQVADKKSIIDNLRNNISTNNKIPDNLSNSFPQSFLQTKIGNFKSQVITTLSNLSSLTQTA